MTIKTKSHRHPFFWICIAIGLLLIITLYGVFDPATAPFPKCPIKALSGWDCPGCGSQRAFHSILNAEFAAAFRYNALAIIAVPFALLLLAIETFRYKFPKLHNRLNSPIIVWGVLIITIGWSIIRNLFFPLP